jgi:hypothetical protein
MVETRYAQVRKNGPVHILFVNDGKVVGSSEQCNLDASHKDKPLVERPEGPGCLHCNPDG